MEENMHFSRVMLGAASLFALQSLLDLGPSGRGQDKKYTAVSIKCEDQKITVTNSGVDLPHFVVYVCENYIIEWDNPNHLKFKVHFLSKCPFSPCQDVTDSNPRKISKQPEGIGWYPYFIVVGDEKFDPHVIGGGGIPIT